MDGPTWMTRKEVAEHLKVHVQTVDRYRREKGLPFRRVSHNAAPRFLKSEVDAWMNEREGS